MPREPKRAVIVVTTNKGRSFMLAQVEEGCVGYVLLPAFGASVLAWPMEAEAAALNEKLGLSQAEVDGLANEARENEKLGRVI